MAGAIVSAPVGGAVAGQIVIPEAQGPWHFTWPDVIAKTAGDLVQGYFDSRDRPDGDDEDDRPAMPAPIAPAAAPMAGGNGIPWLWILVAVGVALFLFRGR